MVEKVYISGQKGKWEEPDLLNYAESIKRSRIIFIEEMQGVQSLGVYKAKGGDWVEVGKKETEKMEMGDDAWTGSSVRYRLGRRL